MNLKRDRLLKRTMPYSGQFTEGRFRNKLRQVGEVSRRPLELSLTLYYAFRDPATPAWCKTVIVGVLGYFISIIDAVPDLTPVLGYTDDLGMMVAAIAVLGANISPQHREQARSRVSALLKP